MTNDTEAPTSAATEAALKESITGSPLLDDAQKEFINICDQWYGIKGVLLSQEDAISEWFYSKEDYKQLISNELIQAALIERGVLEKEKKSLFNPPVGDVSNSRLAKSLTPLQLIVANKMLDITDGRSDKKKLQDLGVSTSRYNQWLQDKTFSGYLRERSEQYLGNSQHEALLALVDKVRAGDTNAIKLYLEFTGRFTPAGQGTTVNISSNGTKQDLKAILITILEIITDEVTDYDTKVRISERIREMINHKSVAEQLLGEEGPIEVPTIQKSRVMTPELNQLTHGKGYE